jgi:hypothetical protein
MFQGLLLCAGSSSLLLHAVRTLGMWLQGTCCWMPWLCAVATREVGPVGAVATAAASPTGRQLLPASYFCSSRHQYR